MVGKLRIRGGNENLIVSFVFPVFQHQNLWALSSEVSSQLFVMRAKYRSSLVFLMKKNEEIFGFLESCSVWLLGNKVKETNF